MDEKEAEARPLMGTIFLVIIIIICICICTTARTGVQLIPKIACAKGL